MNKPITYLTSLLASCCFSLAACMPQSIPPATQSLRTSQTASSAKGPYNGPVSLRINTGLRSKTTGKVVDLSAAETSNSFSIQALPAGAVVFQESFTKNTGNLEELTRNFRVSDPTKRYSLHLLKHEPAQGREGRIQLNLNGSWTIREKDFEGPNLEVLREGLLLNANNSLLLRLRGKKGTRFTLTVIEGGDAGTILRRRGWEKAKNLSQADRLRQNDTNWFIPDNPSSLGGLQPYEGDLSPSETTAAPVGESLANGTTSRIAVGIVTVVLKAPFESNLQALRERFPVKVLSEEDSFSDRFVTLEVDFERLNLSDLPKVVYALNQREDHEPLTEAVFSSVNTAKTIALAALLESQALELIYGVSLRNLGEAEGAIDTQEESVPMPLSFGTFTKAATKTPPSSPVLASKLWWLEAVNAREAWNYSMGENATVAVIDSGFAILRQNSEKIPSKPDFANRVVPSLGESYLRNCVFATGLTPDAREADCEINHNDEAVGTDGQLKSVPGHGLWAISVLASGDNDQDGIVGLAPRAKLMPMYHGSKIEEPIAHQLERLYKDNVPVDVVSISLSRGVNAYDYYFANKSYRNKVHQELNEPLDPILPGQLTGNPDALNPLIERLYRAIFMLSRDRKVIFVAAAGNQGKTYDPSLGLNFRQDVRIPSSMDQVIAVGAYQLENNVPRRADFNTYSDDEPKGSNYGLLADIFAPGKAIWVQGYEFIGGVFIPRWQVIDGTSFATPVVAGTVALMKSINKNLKFADVYNILLNSGTVLNHPSFQEGLNSPVPSYGLNSLKAAEEAANRVPGTKPARNHCIRYSRIQNQGASPIGFNDIRGTVPGSAEVNVSYKGQGLESMTSLQGGEFFEVLGWTQAERPGMASNRIEALQFKVSTEASCLASVGGQGGFQIASAPPANAPADVQFWITSDTRNVPANPTQTLGISVTGTNLQDIQIEIDGKLMPIKQIAQDRNFVSFGILPEIEPGVKNILIRLAGGEVTLEQAITVLAMPPLQELQSIPASSGAIGVPTYVIDNERYLAVTRYYDGRQFHMSSQIFKWDGAQFQGTQNLATSGAYDIQPFKIGSDHFIAVANYDETVFQADSKIYKWNGSQFVEFQSIPVRGITDWEAFEMNGEHYLAMAHFHNVRNDVSSLIYKWNGSSFVQHQAFPVRGAHKWTHFTIGADKFMALTTYLSDQQDTDSPIYKWDGDSFEPYQNIPTDNDMDFEFFTIGEQYFAVVLNLGMLRNPTSVSQLLKWDGSQFVAAQNFATTLATSANHFEANGWHYLMLISGSSNNRIFRWHGTEFGLYRQVLMLGAYESSFFSLGPNDHRLIISNYEGNGYQGSSKMFSFD